MVSPLCLHMDASLLFLLSSQSFSEIRGNLAWANTCFFQGWDLSRTISLMPLSPSGVPNSLPGPQHVQSYGIGLNVLPALIFLSVRSFFSLEFGSLCPPAEIGHWHERVEQSLQEQLSVRIVWASEADLGMDCRPLRCAEDHTHMMCELQADVFKYRQTMCLPCSDMHEWWWEQPSPQRAFQVCGSPGVLTRPGSQSIPRDYFCSLFSLHFCEGRCFRRDAVSPQVRAAQDIP